MSFLYLRTTPHYTLAPFVTIPSSHSILYPCTTPPSIIAPLLPLPTSHSILYPCTTPPSIFASFFPLSSLHTTLYHCPISQSILAPIPSRPVTSHSETPLCQTVHVTCGKPCSILGFQWIQLKIAPIPFDPRLWMDLLRYDNYTMPYSYIAIL